MAAINVDVVAGLLALAGILAALHSIFIRRSLVLGVLAASVALSGAVVALPLTGPSAPIQQPAQEPVDLGAPANFRTFWSDNRVLVGSPIALEIVQQVPSFWFSHARIEAHAEIKDGHWATQPGNLGLEIMRARHVPEEQHPYVPPIVVSYLQSQARTLDILYWYGLVRSSPIRQGDSFIQYMDKTILSWPVSSEAEGDLASVVRLPVGTIAWNIRHDGVDVASPEPWTTARRVLVGEAVAMLLLVVLGSKLLPFAAGRRRQALF